MNDVTRQQVLESRDLLAEIESRGIRVFGTGNQRTAKCPFHEDKNPSFSINVDQGVWKCHGGCGGGSVIDFIARMDNRHPTDVYRELAAELNPPEPWRPVTASPPVTSTEVLEKAYVYQNAEGEEVFQIHRMIPKTFRQGHKVNGLWVGNMNGVTRVPYNLPLVSRAQEVWITEGEKDADTITKYGLVATTNPGGSGAWLDSYALFFEGRDLVYCGDNDEAGAKHLAAVRKSLEGKIKSLRIVEIPKSVDSVKTKDITDYLSAMNPLDPREFLESLRDCSPILPKGISVPVSMYADGVAPYEALIRATQSSVIDLGRWLPSFRHCCRPLVPGDLVTIIAATGMGKTAVLQNIAMSMLDVPQVMFQMELSQESMFERMLGHRLNLTGDKVWSMFSGGTPAGIETVVSEFSNCALCNSCYTVKGITEAVKLSELVFGQRAKLVLIDYIQLMSGGGDSRYERFSNIAEDLRRMATQLGVVVIVTCQARRKEAGETKVGLSDGKESGSIENSSSLVLGMWREEMVEGSGVADKTVVRVLKNSRGPAGRRIECNWNPTFRITEMAPELP